MGSKMVCDTRLVDIGLPEAVARRFEGGNEEARHNWNVAHRCGVRISASFCVLDLGVGAKMFRISCFCSPAWHLLEGLDCGSMNLRAHKHLGECRFQALMSMRCRCRGVRCVCSELLGRESSGWTLSLLVDVESEPKRFCGFICYNLSNKSAEFHVARIAVIARRHPVLWYACLVLLWCWRLCWRRDGC